MDSFGLAVSWYVECVYNVLRVVLGRVLGKCWFAFMLCKRLLEFGICLGKGVWTIMVWFSLGIRRLYAHYPKRILEKIVGKVWFCFLVVYVIYASIMRR